MTVVHTEAQEYRRREKSVLTGIHSSLLGKVGFKLAPKGDVGLR